MLPKYCDCAEEIKDNENSISKYHTARCSVSSAIMCSQKTPNSLTSTCTSYHNRYKRNSNNFDFQHLIDKRSAESDSVTEIMPLTIDPSFDPNFIPPVSISRFKKQENIHFICVLPPSTTRVWTYLCIKDFKYVFILCKVNVLQSFHKCHIHVPDFTFS